MRRMLPPTLAAWTLGLALQAFAQAQPYPGTEAPMLAPRVIRGVTVVNGGASIGEAQAMRRLSVQYPLRVVISGRNGEYHVAERLAVWRDGRLVTEVPNAGPWVLMDLPPGPYTLQGRIDGQAMQRKVTLPSSGITLHWVVPEAMN